MAIEVKRETERLLQKEIRSGNFRSVDELIVEGVHAWREKHQMKSPAKRQRRKQTLSEFLMASPLAGSGLNLERDKDPGRTIRL